MSTSHPPDGIYKSRLIFVTAVVVICLSVTAPPHYGPSAPLIHGAPAPFTKKKPPNGLPSECVMYYYGTAYRTHFRPDGSYSADAIDHHSRWAGRWELRGRILSVTERPSYLREGWGHSTWSVELDRSLRKSLDTGPHHFRLE